MRVFYLLAFNSSGTLGSTFSKSPVFLEAPSVCAGPVFGGPARCDGAEQPVKPSPFLEAFCKHLCAVQDASVNRCRRTSEQQPFARWRLTSFFFFFWLYFFKKWCCNFTQRSSSHTRAGVRREPLCECGPVRESSTGASDPGQEGPVLWSLTSMCEYGSSAASPVAPPAPV